MEAFSLSHFFFVFCQAFRGVRLFIYCFFSLNETSVRYHNYHSFYFFSINL